MPKLGEIRRGVPFVKPRPPILRWVATLAAKALVQKRFGPMRGTAFLYDVASVTCPECKRPGGVTARRWPDGRIEGFCRTKGCIEWTG